MRCRNQKTDHDNKLSTSSKYDFVKIKVWIDNHYYILSRFIVNRILSMSKVQQLKTSYHYRLRRKML